MSVKKVARCPFLDSAVQERTTHKTPALLVRSLITGNPELSPSSLVGFVVRAGRFVHFPKIPVSVEVRSNRRRFFDLARTSNRVQAAFSASLGLTAKFVCWWSEEKNNFACRMVEVQPCSRPTV